MSVETPSTVSITNVQSTAIPQLIPMKNPINPQKIQQPQQQIAQAVNANGMNANTSAMPNNNTQSNQATPITMLSPINPAPPVQLQQQQQQIVNTTDTAIIPKSAQQTQPPELLPPPQQQSEQAETITNVSMQSTPNRKRSREQMLNEQANNLNINTPPNTSTIPAVTSAETSAITPCEPPTKKMKLSDNTHTIDPNSGTLMIESKCKDFIKSLTQNNTEAFDENPYFSATNNTNTNTNNNDTANHDNNNEPKVLQRNHTDLKRYLNTMDDESLKYDLFPKLCLSHKELFESVRQKMNENLILCKIFIRSLSYETEDKTVHDAFLQYGTVKEAVIVKDRQTGKSRGFGFITMSNAAEAQAALVDNRKTIDGREVICNLASKPQGQKTSTDSNSRRGDSFRSDHRGSSQSRSKRGDSRDRNTHHSAPAAYAYAPTANPYAAYDYSNYAYPAAANAMAMNPYAVNPYAMNPYAQYAQVATAVSTTQPNTQQQQPQQPQQQNSNNAAPANIGPQPYAPTTYPPGFAAMPYRFN